jgi:hypothetical protein
MMTRKTAVQALVAIAFVGAGPAYAQEQGATPAGAATPAPAAAGPVATTDGEQPGIRIDVTELKRSSGDTVTLRFSLVNGSSEDFTLADTLRLRGSGQNVSGVYLLDPANKKKYQVIMGADDQCVCSSGVPYTLEAGKAINLWAKFPAPPADVAEVGVVVPHFIPMDGVPIAP